MGLFNFIYKLTNILSNKKKLKVFIIIAIVIVIVFAWSRGCFAAEVSPTNTASLTDYQLVLQQSFIDYLRYLKKVNYVDEQTFRNLLVLMRSQHIYIVPGYDANVQYDVWLYRSNDNGNNTVDDFTIDGYWELGFVEGSSPTIISGTQYPCKLANFRGGHIQILKNDHGTSSKNPTPVVWNQSFHLPDGCFMVRSHSISEFLQEFNIFNDLPTTYNTNDEELQSLTQAGFQNEVNAINNATSAINDVNSSVEDVNQSVMDMIDTIVDPYVNVSQEQLPQSNVQDSTEDGLDNIFTIIKNAFTGTPQSVSFPVPFTDKSFTIEPGFTENSMRKGGLSAMVSVIHLYWYYRIYSFIFLKYVELLEKLKEGEFEETVGNIKKEVL